MLTLNVVNMAAAIAAMDPFQSPIVGQAPRNPLNGIRIEFSADKSTMFVPLPRSAWSPTKLGPCSCKHCGGTEGFWDTLAISVANPHTTWTVHRPEGRR
jgi:hypothetical protein